MLTETYAEVSKISIFSTVASNMNKTKIAEELMDLVPDFAKALDKVNLGSNYGPYFMDHSLQTIVYGPYYMISLYYPVKIITTFGL